MGKSSGRLASHLDQKMLTKRRKYWFYRAYQRKSDAEASAKRQRNKGDPARVQYRKSNKGFPWVVYVSH